LLFALPARWLRVRSGNRPRLGPIALVFKCGTPLMDLVAVHGDGRRSDDPQANLASSDRCYHDANVAVDDDFLPDFPCENQHHQSSLWGAGPAWCWSDKVISNHHGPARTDPSRPPAEKRKKLRLVHAVVQRSFHSLV